MQQKGGLARRDGERKICCEFHSKEVRWVSERFFLLPRLASTVVSSNGDGEERTVVGLKLMTMTKMDVKIMWWQWV